MPMELDPVPPQPAESDWRFVGELSNTPFHQPVRWTGRKPQAGEANFAGGVRLDVRFKDPQLLLETAYADFKYFLESVRLNAAGSYPIVVRRIPTTIREEYRVVVGKDRCELRAGDTEGIRRGLVWMEDEMLRRGGPFLPLGTIARKPWVRTRISRCFFGPVNRPPKLKDELADDVDYYPDEYLNRLAHEGVNGIWLTIDFFKTIPSRIIPEYGRNAAPRLEKLRRTVRKCERYGIRIFPFCVEPAAFDRPYPELAAAGAAHPDLVGDNRAFCTSTEKGQAYLEEATRTLFSEVPGLGGMIVISVGERHTHCFSWAFQAHGCPRCSKRSPFDVLADTLSALKRGMQSVDPDAELISWPYGQFIHWGWGEKNTIEAAGRVPPGVALQHNFETGGWNRQLGKLRPTWDYWQSYVGPAAVFRKCAQRAARNGTRTFAKLQVGCGHEISSTQYVPVPGILHKKYAQMRKLGVSGAMQSWYPGAYPSMMSRTAGDLSFEPFQGEGDFLTAIARRDWGKHVSRVVKAWRLCEAGYRNYPTAHIFQYFGPMHDGVVWPLYLVPRRKPLSPFWQLGYPPSGDHIADCVTNGFTLGEIVVLCRRMAENWGAGAKIMKRLLPLFRSNRDRLQDIRVALAIGIQLRSGYNILRFYELRELLADAQKPADRLRLLKAMRLLVRHELELDRELLPLASDESILGFIAEAEGYKYYPALIRWRMRQLRRLLKEEFPAVERRARRTLPLFPDYTGEQPAGAEYECRRVTAMPAMDGMVSGGAWDDFPRAECRHWLRHVFNPERWKKCGYDPNDHLPVTDAEIRDRAIRWKACRDHASLYLGVMCTPGIGADPENPFGGNSVQILVEPRRTLPRIIFHSGPGWTSCQKDDGYIQQTDNPWRAVHNVTATAWSFVLRIPIRWLRPEARGKWSPMRVNIMRSMPVPGKEGTAICSWAERTPVKGRLDWDTLNPATDFGWLKFD